MKLAKDQSGSALLAAILLIAAIAVMGMASLGMSLKSYQTAQSWVTELNTEYRNGADYKSLVDVTTIPD